jgi:hypothetical protein
MPRRRVLMCVVIEQCQLPATQLQYSTSAMKERTSIGDFLDPSAKIPRVKAFLNQGIFPFSTVSMLRVKLDL